MLMINHLFSQLFFFPSGVVLVLVFPAAGDPQPGPRRQEEGKEGVFFIIMSRGSSGADGLGPNRNSSKAVISIRCIQRSISKHRKLFLSAQS